MSHTLPPIQLFKSTPSTNDLAIAAAKTNPPHGSCWVADQQTKGRGRRQSSGESRPWFSPPGKNLYLSLFVRHHLPPHLVSTLTLAAALGAWRAINPLLEQKGEEAQDKLLIKWPNDLYIAHKKLGGILSEGVMVNNKLDTVVIGIGLNINLSSEDLPDELKDIATSLQIATSSTHDRLSLAHTLREELLLACTQLEQLGLPFIIKNLQPIDQTIGRSVSTTVNGQPQQGTSLGIAPSGGLLIQLTTGQTIEVQSGEVLFI